MPDRGNGPTFSSPVHVGRLVAEGRLPREAKAVSALRLPHALQDADARTERIVALALAGTMLEAGFRIPVAHAAASQWLPGREAVSLFLRAGCRLAEGRFRLSGCRWPPAYRGGVRSGP